MIGNVNKYKAFTLAEVLISLVIIGVIAAITMPVLIQKYQEQAIKSALKKNYSILKSALDKYQIEHGERLMIDDINTTMKLKSILMKYLNVVKDCGLCDCASSTNKIYTTYNGKELDYHQFCSGQFILADGTFVIIHNPNWADSYRIILISVDVNGIDKKPNRLGKDLFLFQLSEKGELLPGGASGTAYSKLSSYCSNNNAFGMNGAGCTVKVLKN